MKCKVKAGPKLPEGPARYIPTSPEFQEVLSERTSKKKGEKSKTRTNRATKGVKKGISSKSSNEGSNPVKPKDLVHKETPARRSRRKK